MKCLTYSNNFSYREEDDREFQLWQTDWDNWTKPEEDLTLTPHSVDPVPSPTPSTFLFPPNPTPSPVGANLRAFSPSASSINQNDNLISPGSNINEATISDDESVDTMPFSPEAPPSKATDISRYQSTEAIDNVALKSSASLPSGMSSEKTSSSLKLSLDITKSLSIKVPSEEKVNSSSCDKNNQLTCAFTPPSQLPHQEVPLTPSSERRLKNPTSGEGVRDLVCDLFPGAGGDASILDKIKDTDIVQENDVSTDSTQSKMSLLLKEHKDTNIKYDDAIATSSSTLSDSLNSQANVSTPGNLQQLLSFNSTPTIASTITPAPTLKQHSDNKPSQILYESISDRSVSSRSQNGKILDSSSSTNIALADVTFDGEREHLLKKEGMNDSAQPSISQLRIALTGGHVESTVATPFSSEGQKDTRHSSNSNISELFVDVNETQTNSNTDECEEENDVSTMYTFNTQLNMVYL